MGSLHREVALKNVFLKKLGICGQASFFFWLPIIEIPASAETILWQLPVWGSSQRVWSRWAFLCHPFHAVQHSASCPTASGTADLFRCPREL